MNSRLSRTCARVAPHACRAGPKCIFGKGLGQRGLLRVSRILEKERWTRTREKGRKETRSEERRRKEVAAWPLHGPPRTESSRPNLTYPRWDLSVGFTCHGLYRYLPYCLPLPIYQESPHCYFPFPRTDHPASAAHSYESRISSFSVRRVRAPLKVTGKIFGATITPRGC